MSVRQISHHGADRRRGKKISENGFPRLEKLQKKMAHRAVNRVPEASCYFVMETCSIQTDIRSVGIMWCQLFSCSCIHEKSESITYWRRQIRKNTRQKRGKNEGNVKGRGRDILEGRKDEKNREERKMRKRKEEECIMHTEISFHHSTTYLIPRRVFFI